MVDGAPPPPPPPPPISSSILLNKYKMGRLLGRGSFAKVHSARSIADNTPVAIKIIDKSILSLDPSMESRITCEISTMRRLHHHPNILKIHEVMATKTKIYLVMELASGGELFSKVLRSGRLKESSARMYFQQLVSALHFCHQNGVAHRDLKPQNLLLDENGNVKVSDFGLSALPEQLKNGLLHTACGTPAYTAPEVVARRGYAGEKADAWSCGVILYVLLAGSLPFKDNNLPLMYKKVHRREYKMPNWISKPARSIIYQLLDPNPNTRMSIEAVMQSSWFKKSLQLPSEDGLMDQATKPSTKLENIVTSMNAFDIISLSSGLDLSGLFEATSNNSRGKRFTSRESLERVMERVKEVGMKSGYRVKEGKRGAMGLGKGRAVVAVEVLEMAPSLLLVEMKVVGSGGEEFEDNQWWELKEGLEDVVLSWHGTEAIVAAI
ncbi:CBL-interacting serine/threonine-protein kinase 7-like [Tripterygium wilfordii]|uniref:non-specific serine/threonine protein kinase n=1 Tax=Tripterygium wilfordii TaxID=458696 RepID=A0A7J7CX48_TRIWF|nr:CBL-interacting serine/threonine-protein kinase 7-like [Tripterygium wilfordii]XP_038721010.1 CBL-interacting serine/threonine-protein kinase 7-like [Tripterygium wilfordii]KAF5738588.1 CBL-interacting serine/threonine-protein kinase 7-like [Tripterygium wilfordii]